MHPRKAMDEKELNKFLEIMVEKLLEKKPELAKNKELLIEQTAQLLKMKFAENPNKLNLHLIRQPDFIKQVALTMMVSAELQQDKKLSAELDKSLQKLLKNEKFMAEFQKLIQDPSIKNTKELSKKMDALLDKHLDKESKSTLKEVFSKLADMISLKKTGKPSTDPEDEANMALTSLLCNEAGSMRGIVQFQPGNLFSVPDQDPYNGDAFINRINDTSSAIPDYQSTQHATRENFDSIEATVTSILQAVNNESMLNPNTPKLTHH